MKKISEIYNWFAKFAYKGVSLLGITRGQDKVLHFISAFIINIIMMLIFETVIALLITLFIIILKEFYDIYIEQNWKMFDFFDFFAGLLGITLSLFTFKMATGLITGTMSFLSVLIIICVLLAMLLMIT